MRNVLLTTIMLLAMSTLMMAQTSIEGKSAIGIWKTIDDETGKEKSQVQITESGGKYAAKIIKLLDPETLKDSKTGDGTDLVCDNCPSDRGKDQPLIGLTMLWDMEKLSSKYGEGKIMDPKNGKVYSCTMWLDDKDTEGNTLKVRGWIAFLFRTQTWYRVE